MATTYIFAIGGTGARVLRPLTMLLASGCAGTTSEDEIVPIIVDYDISNGDTDRTQKLMDKYCDIHNAIHVQGTPERKERFFGTPIKKIKDKVTKDRFKPSFIFDPQSRFDIHLDQKQTDRTFADYLDFESLGDNDGTLPTRQLLESLYDSSPKESPRAELNLNLSQGFKGCPNIGCIVTKDIAETPEFKNFVNNFNEINDKILIIGSVFGGTGASGIPMLLDLIRSKKDWNKQSVAVGVMAMLPYFKVVEDKDSAISSDTFKAKAKAAITAYELPGSVNFQANSIYYVGDNDMQQPFNNHEGGAQQINDALFPEFVAAICCMDFIKRSRNSIVGIQSEAAIAYEVGFTDNAPITVPSLVASQQTVIKEGNIMRMEHFFSEENSDVLKKPYIDPLTRLFIFMKFCKEYLCKEKMWSKSDTWLMNSGLSSKKDFIKDLGAFADSLYNWLKEMAGPQRPLLLYHPDNDWKDWLDGKKLETGRWIKDPLFDANSISTALGKSFAKNQVEDFKDFAEFMFIENSSKTTKEMLEKIELFNCK